MVIFGIAFGIVIPRSTGSCGEDKKAWSLLGQRHQASNKKSQNLQGVREEWRLEEYARKSFTMVISSTEIREGLSNRIDE